MKSWNTSSNASLVSPKWNSSIRRKYGLFQQLWSLFILRSVLTTCVLPRCSSIWRSLFIWTGCMWLVCVQPSLGLEKSRWRPTSGERRHAGCHSAENPRLAVCVCWCLCVCECECVTTQKRLVTTYLTLLSVKKPTFWYSQTCFSFVAKMCIYLWMCVCCWSL